MLTGHKRLLGALVPLLCLGACQTAQPIVLRPEAAPPRHAVVRHAPALPTPPSPPRQTQQPVESCGRPAANVSQSEREAIFREFDGRQAPARAMSSPVRRGANEVCRPVG